MKTIIRKDEEAVSPVIATILMVAITVVLAAVLYVMVSGLIGGPSTSKPTVAFTTGVPVTNGEQLSIASASQAVGPANYKINLQVNSTAGAAVAMPLTSGTSVTITVGAPISTSFIVAWTDIGGEKTLNGGDSFTVTRAAGLPAQSSYTFFLLWSDGGQVTSTTFSTP
ncbi:MAG: type IV pilin N-terminal domain-containing protein [Candidatus Thermoplasmatota archaeon]